MWTWMMTAAFAGECFGDAPAAYDGANSCQNNSCTLTGDLMECTMWNGCDGPVYLTTSPVGDTFAWYGSCGIDTWCCTMGHDQITEIRVYGNSSGTTIGFHYDDGIDVADLEPLTSATSMLWAKIYAGDGDDLIYGSDYVGSDYADILYGEDDSDDIFGGAGRDYINGGAGWDGVFAGPGNDRVDGGPDNDALYGENGNDTLCDEVQSGSTCNLTSLFGGNGDDTLWVPYDSSCALHASNGGLVLDGGGHTDECGFEDWEPGSLWCESTLFFGPDCDDPSP